MTTANVVTAVLDKVENKIGTTILIHILKQYLTPKKILELVDALLAFLQDLAKRTTTPVDDAVLKTIRHALHRNTTVDDES